MAGPMDPSTYIHLGLWVNQSKSRPLGLTLTVSPTTATLLTNLLALFVTMAGGQCWNIIRFSLHQLRAFSSNHAVDVGFIQQQVVLRNATSASSTAQLLMQLGWSSRKSSSTSQRRFSTLPVIMLAILTAVFFVVAGAFSNTITDAGPNVLSRSPFCGLFNQTYLDIAARVLIPPTTAGEEAMIAEYNAKAFQDVQHSQQYSQECYYMQGTGSSNCDTFQKSTLITLTTTNEKCPFDEKICLEGVDTVVFDTGPVDSYKDLGINAAPKDRLTYRQVANCTVLNDTSYTTGWINQSDASPTQPTWQIANASYGYSLYRDTNESYSYSNFADFYTGFASEYSLSYTLGHDIAYGFTEGSSTSTFVPILELNQKNADLVLFYLSYIGLYLEPIDDPWFKATVPVEVRTSPTTVVTTYSRDKPITTVGCTQQYQVCTSPESCTSLLGYDQVQESVSANLSLTPKQNVTLSQIFWSGATAAIDQVAATLAQGTTPFLATQKRQNGKHTVSVPLPPDQWKRELSNWHSIAMAQLQRLTVESETGQIAAQPQYLLPPATESEIWICENLLIRSNVYKSFNVVALVLLISVGTMVIVLSLTVELLALWFLRRIGRGELGNKVWRDHDMLEPQLWREKVRATDSSEGQSLGPHKRSSALPRALSNPDDEKAFRRASSQALSFEDQEKLLIARAYDSWI